MGLEKLIENKLKKAVEKQQGWCLKFWPISFAGFPDRIVLLPGGKIYFVELKSPIGKLSLLQESRIAYLRKLGFLVWVIALENELENFIIIITK